MMTIEELKKIFEPLSQKKVHTSYGPRYLKVYHNISKEFWEFYNWNKELINSMGFSVSKDKRNGFWIVCQWIPIEEPVKQYTVDNGNVPLDWDEYRKRKAI